jgi:predicted ATPase
VQGLLSKKDDTLIFEQPELHCHPRVQSRLADFFLSLTLMGRQCIVETHSEYIVKRMRTLIAEDLDNTLNHLIQIYFASRSDGETIFRNIEVNEYGAILDWPPGFFDEAENEGNRLIKSAILKKSKIKKDTNIDRGS